MMSRQSTRRRRPTHVVVFLLCRRRLHLPLPTSPLSPPCPTMLMLLLLLLLAARAAAAGQGHHDAAAPPPRRTIEEFAGLPVSDDAVDERDSSSLFRVDPENLQRQIDELASFSDSPAPSVTRVLCTPTRTCKPEGRVLRRDWEQLQLVLVLVPSLFQANMLGLLVFWVLLKQLAC